MQCFNSRPHEEVDEKQFADQCRELGFQLTTSRRGRRCQDGRGSNQSYVSTHDLTKRSTNSMNFVVDDIVFQLTTSRRGRQLCTFLITDTCMFQLTTSRRGRQQTKFQLSPIYRFNSRPHEEVDVIEVLTCYFVNMFQLTTSRRGRRQFRGL